ncbi:MAG TPA: PA2779 family protein [Nitrospiraceae bacterium]|nr:PA2779 family protein [Nitrospiraceae bacterium]
MPHTARFRRSLLPLLALSLALPALDSSNGMAALVPADPVQYGSQQPASVEETRRDGTRESSPAEDLRVRDLEKVQKILEMKVVQQRLEDLGLSAEEAQNRLNRLSDAQLHLLASQIDQLFPGGIDHVLGTILTVLLIILVAVIIVILV